jgi:ABC-type transporter Mla maintaining outer membrane lipid asymmetry ATPase subunit MlaF
MPIDKYHKIDIAWNDLCVSAPSKVKGEGTVSILKSTAGTVTAGHVTSIMGPSGAGKTTMVCSCRASGPFRYLELLSPHW